MMTRTKGKIRYKLRVSVRGSEGTDPPDVVRDAIALNLALESNLQCVGFRLVSHRVLPREEARSSGRKVRFRAFPLERQRKKR